MGMETEEVSEFPVYDPPSTIHVFAFDPENGSAFMQGMQTIGNPQP
jgi:hypothetical protein